MWFLYFVKDFLSVPALLVGLFTLVGALVQRQKFSKTVISVFKVVIGFLVMVGGATVLTGSLKQFQPVFKETYGLDGIIPNNDGLAGSMAKALPKIVSLASVLMVVGMIANISLAFISRMKYVYLSGHVLYYMSIMLALIMYTSGMNFENNAGDYALAVFAGGSILSTYMIITPAVSQRYMRQIVGTDEIALGHTGGFGYALSGFLGEMIGKISKKDILSTEAIKFPQSLYFFRNTLVSITLTVLVFYMAAFLPGGILFELGKISKTSSAGLVLSEKNWLVTMFVAAFSFTAGVEIILMGVRLFVGELVPMFKGISDKVIKGAKAAVDCPVVFPYAPNAVLIGFIASFFGGLIGMGITIGMHAGGALAAVILPGLIPHFFLGATSGVFGNIKGGILGALVGPFIMGIVITFVPVMFLAGHWAPATSKTLHDLAIKGGQSTNAIDGLNWGDTDYFIGVIPGLFGKISKYAAFGVSILGPIAIIVDGIIARFKGWGPYSPESKAKRAEEAAKIFAKKEESKAAAKSK